MILLGPTTFWDAKATTHLIEWKSAKIDRKVASTLAAEANGGSMAYDRSMYVRAVCAEIESPLSSFSTSGIQTSWKEACSKIPFCLGTDCKSLYDTCIKPASTTKDKRVALDLLDVREGIEEYKDSVRWVPTDHMLVDCLTKAMHPALLNQYMKDYQYSFKFDDLLKETKRAAAKERKQAREEKLKQGGKKQQQQQQDKTQQQHKTDKSKETHATNCVFMTVAVSLSLQPIINRECRTVDELMSGTQIPPWRQAQAGATEGNTRPRAHTPRGDDRSRTPPEAAQPQ